MIAWANPHHEHHAQQVSCAGGEDTAGLAGIDAAHKDRHNGGDDEHGGHLVEGPLELYAAVGLDDQRHSEDQQAELHFQREGDLLHLDLILAHALVHIFLCAAALGGVGLDLLAVKPEIRHADQEKHPPWPICAVAQAGEDGQADHLLGEAGGIDIDNTGGPADLKAGNDNCKAEHTVIAQTHDQRNNDWDKRHHVLSHAHNAADQEQQEKACNDQEFFSL